MEHRLFQDGEHQRALAKGDRVKITATLKRSDKDPKFGFDKRPCGQLVK